MSGIAYELVPEAEAPDELQPGVTRYVEQPDGGVEEYIGDEDGNPVLVSGRSQVLFAADLYINKNSSNNRTVFCDVLGLTNVEYAYSEPDYYYGEIAFNTENPPNSAKTKLRVRHATQGEHYSVQYRPQRGNYEYGEVSVVAYEAGVDDSLVLDPGKFHVYVEIVQF
jgi:hypothetical protein